MQAKLPLAASVFSICSLTLLTGCHRGQTITQADAALPTNQAAPLITATHSPVLGTSSGTSSNPSQAAALAELLPWLIVELPQQQAPQATKAPGPSLVAGDWLAFQCAMAGGYWDTPRDENTPTFAGVTQDGPMPE